MADSALSGLSAATAISDDDLFLVTDDPAGTPASKKVTAAVVADYMREPGYINGLTMTYSSTTALIIEAGDVKLNGTIRSLSQTTYTSGSTMKDIAGNTVTIGASKAYHVFAYNNAGTLEARFEEADGTGDGAAPTFDSTLEYYKAATTGAEARRIGKFWTNASSQIVKFWAMVKGTQRFREMRIPASTAINLIVAGTASTNTALTITPYLTADDLTTFIRLGCAVSSGTSVAANVFISVDAGTTDVASCAGMTSSGITIVSTEAVIPYTGTIHYRSTATNGTSTVQVVGFGQMV
jgi:hypothetical protein